MIAANDVPAGPKPSASANANTHCIPSPDGPIFVLHTPPHDGRITGQGGSFPDRLESLKLEFNAQTDRELVLVERLTQYNFICDSIAAYTDMSKIPASSNSRPVTTPPEATPEELVDLGQLFTRAEAGERFTPDQASRIVDRCRRSAADTIVRLYIARVQRRRSESMCELPQE